MQDAVRSHPELRLLGDPTFLFSFTSDEFDIYHVNDFMRTRGWRFNGQQYPNAIHMAVTRPQTQPGVADEFATDLADAVAYAKEHADEAPKSGAIYGGVAGGMTDEADEFIKMVMADMLDKPAGRAPERDRRPAAAADEQFVLAVDLGTGGPKVGLVSLTGAIAWHDHIPVTTRQLPDGGAVQDADEWWDAIVDATRRALAVGRGRPDPRRGGELHRPVGEHRAGRRRGRAGRRLPALDGHARPATGQQRFGGPISGYAPRALFAWVRRTGGAPSTTGADPDRPHALPRLTTSPRCCGRPAGCSSRSTTCRCASPGWQRPRPRR